MNYQEIIAGLRALQAEDFEPLASSSVNGIGRLYELTEALAAQPAPERAASELFTLLERLPDADFGSPGPLVHCLESLPGHEAALKASVERQPTFTGIWMVSRFLNDASLSPERHDGFIDSLVAAIEHPNVSDDTRDQAEDLLERHAPAV